MKLNKYVSLTLAAALAVSGAYADDFDFGDDFGFGGAGDSGSSSPVEISGSVDGTARAYITGDDDVSKLPMAGDVTAKLDVKYSGTNADAEIKLKLDSKTIKENPEGIIDEAYATAYLGNFKLEAGQMKNVWGKGDKLHVIDNFNADDYSDFIIPDYLDRRVATPMLKGSYALDYSGKVLSNVKVEGVYTPFMPVDKFATKGVWTPAQVSGLTGTVTNKATNMVASAFTDYTTQTATVAVLKSIGADATAAATALATAQKNYNDLSAISNRASAAGLPAYAVYNQKTGATLTSEAQFTALLQQAQVAAVSATVNNETASKEYAQALKTAGVESIEQAEAKLKVAGTNYMYSLTNASALSNNPDLIYPNTNQFKYGQAGARVTASLGYVDLGMSYYYGHYKQPSVDVSKIDNCVNKYLLTGTISEEDKFLTYDQKQTFGLEAATILWHFNVRGEACYNLTEDIDGTNPWVHNNSVQWLGGFDIDLPIWNMNVNIQETGTYVLGNDKIAGSATELMDVDYNKNGYTNDRLVANITTSFMNDRVLPEVTVMYGIENGDVVVLPKFVVKPTSELSLSASGMYIWCRDNYSEFTSWNKNSFVQLGATLTF